MSNLTEESVFVARVDSLHQHFNTVVAKLDSLEEGHKRLEEADRYHERRMSALELEIARDVGNLATHVATTGVALEGINRGLLRLEVGFTAHAKQEGDDRRWLVWMVVITLLASVGGLFTLLFGG